MQALHSSFFRVLMVNTNTHFVLFSTILIRRKYPSGISCVLYKVYGKILHNLVNLSLAYLWGTAVFLSLAILLIKLENLKNI